MAKLPKNIIKKCGITKKAWAVFRGNKKTTRSENTMAKRKGRNSFKSSNGSVSLMNVAGAGAIHGIARPMIANILPSFFSFGPVDSDNVIIGGAGYYAMKKGSGIIKILGMLTLANEVSYVTQKVTGNNQTQQTNAVAYNYGDM